jgi:hypothetical protein
MFARSARLASAFNRRLAACLAVVLLCGALAAPVSAQPSAMNLFPQDTLLLVRVANGRELGERFKETSTGRMLHDPQLQPFIERLYGGAADLYTDKLQQTLGISWDELSQLPQGEVAFAIVARSAQSPAFLLLVDQGETESAARRLLDRAVQAVQENGGEISTETIDGVEATVVRDGDDQNKMFGMFERENTIVVATDANVLRNVLHHWNAGETSTVVAAAATTTENDDQAESDDDEDTAADAANGDSEEEPFTPSPSIAENHKFTTILRHSRRPHDPPPQLLFYVDPIGLAEEFGRDNSGLQMALGWFPALGIDGLQAIGGALTFATGEYDDLSHIHVLLENPRAGLLQIIQFQPGDMSPQPWVPRNVENYITWRWNFPATFDRAVTMADHLIGEGKLEERIASDVSEPLGIELRKEIIDNLSGRVTWLTGYEKPARMNSGQNTIAVELVDEAAAAATLKTLMGRFPDLFEERQFGDVTYYAITPDWWKDMEEDARPFNPFVAIMDGQLFAGGSTQLFEQVIAVRDGTAERLVDSPDYMRLAATLGRETAGQTPAMFLMQRSEESLRHVYDLLTAEKSRAFLEENAEGNALFTALLDALDANELPPFESLLQYMGAGGGILYDMDNGYHGISFTLRNEAAP